MDIGVAICIAVVAKVAVNYQEIEGFVLNLFQL